jgi:hypothetical protein
MQSSPPPRRVQVINDRTGEVRQDEQKSPRYLSFHNLTLCECSKEHVLLVEGHKESGTRYQNAGKARLLDRLVPNSSECNVMHAFGRNRVDNF